MDTAWVRALCGAVEKPQRLGLGLKGTESIPLAAQGPLPSFSTGSNKVWQVMWERLGACQKGKQAGAGYQGVEACLRKPQAYYIS